MGLLGALCLGAYQVAYKGETIGKFSILVAYWAQLQSRSTLAIGHMLGCIVLTT